MTEAADSFWGSMNSSKSKAGMSTILNKTPYGYAWASDGSWRNLEDIALLHASFHRVGERFRPTSHSADKQGGGRT